MLRTQDKRLFLGQSLGSVVPREPWGIVEGYNAWYDASDVSTLTVVSDALSGWADRSVNGWDLAQATAGNRPPYGGAGARTINGITVPEFVPASNSFMTSSLPVDVTTVTLFGVALKDGSAGITVLTSGNQTSGPRSVYLDGLQLSFSRMGSAGASSGLSATANTAFAWAIRYSGSSVDFWLDAGESFGVAYSQTFTGGTTLTLGRRNDGSLDWDGLMAELIFYDEQLTDAQVMQNLRYLSVKWGTPTP